MVAGRSLEKRTTLFTSSIWFTLSLPALRPVNSSTRKTEISLGYLQCCSDELTVCGDECAGRARPHKNIAKHRIFRAYEHSYDKARRSTENCRTVGAGVCNLLKIRVRTSGIAVAM